MPADFPAAVPAPARAQPDARTRSTPASPAQARVNTISAVAGGNKYTIAIAIIALTDALTLAVTAWSITVTAIAQAMISTAATKGNPRCQRVSSAAPCTRRASTAIVTATTAIPPWASTICRAHASRMGSSGIALR